MEQLEVYNMKTLLRALRNNKYTLFSFFLCYSEIFEERLESIIRQAYKDNVRCTQITQQYVKEHGLFDNLDYDTVLEAMWEHDRINSVPDELMPELKNFVENDKEFFSYIYEEIQDSYRYVIQEMNFHADADIDSAKELEEVEDNKGDVHTTGKRFCIDTPVRDYPFIIYQGKWLNWDNELNAHAHSDIIDKIFGKGKARSVNLRDIENIQDIDPTQPIIFGDKVGDLGFIEACQNISIEEAANILKKRFRKVYQFQQMENQVERLAKRRLVACS